MIKVCRRSGIEFEVQPADLALLERISPEFGGIKQLLPPPTICPSERKRQRLCFRNERNLYHKSCALTGKPVISVFSPDKPVVVYSKDAWWSDSWDARTYGREFDFSRPFFEQFAEMKAEVPQVALITSPDADENNCPYINFAGNSKNCYMTFDSDFNEDSYYTNVLKHSRNCVDCSYVLNSDLCYECIDCSRCYNLFYSQDCSGCSDGYFLKDCIGCSNCCMCVNLVQKSYHIRNVGYSREEYERRLSEMEIGRRSRIDELRAEAESFSLKFPKRFAHVLKTENCSGDYILNARNCFLAFNVSDAEDLRYCDSVFAAKTCADVSSFGENIECVYNSGTIGINCYRILMSYVIVLNCSNMIYCDNSRQSSHCFGCSSMRSNQYCILNKQYSKDDYEKLAPRIIAHMRETGEWGEYFPAQLSPFGYNETIAQEIFPLTKDQALAAGFKWSDYTPPPPKVKTVPANSLPETSVEIDEKITECAVSCAVSGRPFRITKAEVEFYRRQHLPLPQLHSDERHKRRIAKRNPQELYQRRCAETGRVIETSYSPERPEVVYCEEAYQKALI